ncbi:SDR family NAD(P)-dependent oxidoreductase [Denitratisoma oestradiolicum]|uniref:Oxidoreductase n=1 Tax=Denitratisoma oestradiolicum TaxID=311182 RepID=A0A6S6YQ26_9PROT|nr:SDR family NAD(P)-dependent oxidoreductase [Denitratisoma oestradiolicum]TWO78880.1 oxidoreductase [Denitratisoma oestradiolicum]CAB1369870.1 Oxidoreductase [Denitratisoma oestradiolicum]
MTSKILFAGGTAVITGAAGGVGGGLARKAAVLGMNLVLADLDSESLYTLADSLDTEVLVVPTDVTHPAALENLANQAWNRFGRVDLLFNNAGIMCAGFTWEISPEAFGRCFAVNVLGIHNGIRAFVPRMLKAGTPAHIVNTASMGGFLPSPLLSPYTATKSAVFMLSECLYGELKMINAPIGISVLHPGPVQSGIFGSPFGDGGGNPVARQFIDAINQQIAGDGGITPDQSAELTFAGIQAGEFWILAESEFLDPRFRERVEGILERRPPKIFGAE